MSQQIPQPTAEDRAIDRERAYQCSHLLPDPGGEVVRQFLRLLHAAEAELTAESQQREAAEKLVMELERQLDDKQLEAKGHREARQTLADDLIALANGMPVRLELGGAVERKLATVRAETVEECGMVCQREGEFRQLRALQRRNDGDFAQERIQDHKAITAFALATVIRRLNATTTEPPPSELNDK